MYPYIYIFYTMIILLLNACVPIAHSQHIVIEKNSIRNSITLNASDKEQNPLEYAIIDIPKHGKISMLDSKDNIIHYTPTTGYIGKDHFTFIAKDAEGSSPIATVSITIYEAKENHRPIAQKKSITVNVNSVENSIILQASDEDNDPLRYEITEKPLHGTLVFKDSSESKEVLYSPDNNYTGKDHFLFIAKDASSHSLPQDVIITVKNHTSLLIIKDRHDRSNCKKYVELSGKDLNANGLLEEEEIISRSPIYETEPPISIETLQEMIHKGEDVTHVNTCQITDMSALFILQDTNYQDPSQMVNIFNQDISQWNTGAVTDMSNMFQDCTFNQDIGEWDVSHVESMAFMFVNARNFNQNISNWDVSSVIDMHNMFTDAIQFNQSLNKWHMSQVENITFMFFGASQFDKNISDWNVSHIKDFSGMFTSATHFNQDISRWDVRHAENFEAMFAGATHFNQDISQWHMGQAISLNAMFIDATHFDQNITRWNVQHVKSFSQMFKGATLFKQDISDWNVSQAQSLEGMFQDTQIETETYNKILQKWSTLALQPGVFFHAGKSHYSQSATDARQKMINTFHWNIVDQGLDEPVAPIAKSVKVALIKNTTLHIMLRAKDANEDNLSYHIQTLPKHGILSGTPPTVFYTPEANYTGEDTFTFTANDGEYDSNISTITINTVDIVETQDSDEDGIPDQIELLLGSDFQDNDENNNNIPDGLETEGIYGDTFFDKQWHIKSMGSIVNDSNVSTILGNDLHLSNVYHKYMGLNHGNPIIVQVVDTGTEITHEDLQANIDYSRQYYYPENDNVKVWGNHPHGTMVAGIIAARAFNGRGVRGVAPFVKLSTSNWLESNQTLSDLEEVWFSAKGANEIAISNQSWGTPIIYGASSEIDYETIMQKGVTQLRDGKGRIYVFAAGNDRQLGGNANMSYADNNRYVITVAGLTHENKYAWYSNPGANLLISGYSGEMPDVMPAIGTTFFTGYSAIGRDTWKNDYTHSYTYSMGGTSSAAPIVSAVIALTLEACPSLTWRDIKYLIATTGTKVDNNNSSWVKNSTGLWHSNDYGYGLINTETMISQCSDKNYVQLPHEKIAETSGTMHTAIQDAEFVEIGGLDLNTSMKIEWVELTIDTNHTMAGDLKIELISPAGTRHTLIEPTTTYPEVIEAWMEGGFRFGAAGFIDEESKGAWKVKISDMKENGHTGVIHALKLKVYGH